MTGFSFPFLLYLWQVGDLVTTFAAASPVQVAFPFCAYESYDVLTQGWNAEAFATLSRHAPVIARGYRHAFEMPPERQASIRASLDMLRARSGALFNQEGALPAGTAFTPPQNLAPFRLEDGVISSTPRVRVPREYVAVRASPPSSEVADVCCLLYAGQRKGSAGMLQGTWREIEAVDSGYTGWLLRSRLSCFYCLDGESGKSTNSVPYTIDAI